MKKKDIKIGEEYAIAARGNAARFPLRGKVTKVGVRGILHNRWFGRDFSKNPNYVEFEIAEKDEHMAWRYEGRLLIRPSEKPGDSGDSERFPTPMELAVHPGEPVGTVVYRAPFSHVLRTWAEQEEREAEARRLAEKAEERLTLLLNRYEDQATRFKGFGINSQSGYDRGVGNITLSPDEAEKVLKFLEAVSQFGEDAREAVERSRGEYFEEYE